MSHHRSTAVLAALAVLGTAALAATFTTLDDYDSNGVPDNLETTRDTYSQAFRDDVVASLPERRDLLLTNPEFIDPDAVANLHFDEDADVTISFVHEGAGYLNVAGVFFYDTDAPPTSAADVERVVVFPNASLRGAGGGLRMGDTVDLGEVQAGQSMGFFVTANGFKRNVGVTEGNWTVYSLDDLNPESTAALRRHVVLLDDPDDDRFVIAFEDLRRDRSGNDNDFNDVMLSVRVTPETALDTTGVETLIDAGDRDGDGVANHEDDYPDDAARAFKTLYPATGPGTLAYEDQWPSMGDYDFNDLVLHYRITEARNADDEIVDVTLRYTPVAMGAARHNGLRVRLPVARSAVDTVTRSVDDGGRSTWSTLSGHTDAVVSVFSDAYDLIAPASGNKYANTEDGTTLVTGKSVELRIVFDEPLADDALGAAPYDTYLVNGGAEVHLAGFEPSDSADRTLLGTADDATDLDAGESYVNADGLPWALHVPRVFEHPVEGQSVVTGYADFERWAESGGTEKPDWHRRPHSSRSVIWRASD